MKKYIIILFSIITFASGIAIGQIKPIKRGQKPKTEQKKGQKKKQTSKKSNAQNQSTANNSETSREMAIQTAKDMGAEAAQRVTDDLRRSDVKTITAYGVSFDMVFIEGGTFLMGGTVEQGGEAYETEKPVHRVSLSSYYIGQFEVTQELWQAVMGKNPSRFTGNLNFPVESVSWDDCQEFIRKLNQITGRQFRLPTEAEWEFAARGGNHSQNYKYAGGNNINIVAWHEGNSSRSTHTVGSKSPNELGLYDISGNVWEWCSDMLGPYGSGAQSNPKGSYTGRNRVCRGGSWDENARFCRTSYRVGHNPQAWGAEKNPWGLRLAATSL